MEILTRRAILRALGLSPVIAISPIKASPSRKDEQLDILLCCHRRLVIQRSELDRRWLRAHEQLPRWCVPGLKYVDRNGVPCGQLVGWPEANWNDMIELHDGRLLARPGPADLRALFNVEKAIDLKEAQANYRRQSSQLTVRLRQKRASERTYGLPTTKDWAQIDAEIDGLEEAISYYG